MDALRRRVQAEGGLTRAVASGSSAAASTRRPARVMVYCHVEVEPGEPQLGDPEDLEEVRWVTHRRDARPDAGHVRAGAAVPGRAAAPAAGMNRSEEWRQIHRDAQREMGNRADAINRQPWRIWRNRRLRAEILAIMAVMDPEYEQGKRRPPAGELQPVSRRSRAIARSPSRAFRAPFPPDAWSICAGLPPGLLVPPGPAPGLRRQRHVRDAVGAAAAVAPAAGHNR